MRTANAGTCSGLGSHAECLGTRVPSPETASPGFKQQGLRVGPQVLVFTSLTRFSSLSNFAISTAGPFCTSCPFFSYREGKYP